MAHDGYYRWHRSMNTVFDCQWLLSIRVYGIVAAWRKVLCRHAARCSVAAISYARAASESGCIISPCQCNNLMAGLPRYALLDVPGVAITSRCHRSRHWHFRVDVLGFISLYQAAFCVMENRASFSWPSTQPDILIGWCMLPKAIRVSPAAIYWWFLPLASHRSDFPMPARQMLYIKGQYAFATLAVAS